VFNYFMVMSLSCLHCSNSRMSEFQAIMQTVETDETEIEPQSDEHQLHLPGNPDTIAAANEVRSLTDTSRVRFISEGIDGNEILVVRHFVFVIYMNWDHVTIGDIEHELDRHQQLLANQDTVTSASELR